MCVCVCVCACVCVRVCVCVYDTPYSSVSLMTHDSGLMTHDPCCFVFASPSKSDLPSPWYWVATISRLLEKKGLFCRISSALLGSFAKETYNFKEPTNCSHPIWVYIHGRYVYMAAARSFRNADHTDAHRKTAFPHRARADMTTIHVTRYRHDDHTRHKLYAHT